VCAATAGIQHQVVAYLSTHASAMTQNHRVNNGEHNFIGRALHVMR
jgi:hypothetical protein